MPSANHCWHDADVFSDCIKIYRLLWFVRLCSLIHCRLRLQFITRAMMRLKISWAFCLIGIEKSELSYCAVPKYLKALLTLVLYVVSIERYILLGTRVLPVAHYRWVWNSDMLNSLPMFMVAVNSLLQARDRSSELHVADEDHCKALLTLFVVCDSSTYLWRLSRWTMNLRERFLKIWIAMNE